MTLQEIKTLLAYNAWASHKLFEVLSSLPDDHYAKDMNSSHGGIHGTLIHMVGAEKIWLERFKGAPQPPLSQNPPRSLAELMKIWETVGYDMAHWLGSMTDKKLTESFTAKTLSGDTFTNTFIQALQHVVNHSSYHRGQIVTMMRQLGAKPPSTDLIRFYRETAKR
jgi:uncharacterized damage-inducible protein DinB